MSIAVEDWDDLAAARQRRGEREAAAAPPAESEPQTAAVGVSESVGDGYEHHELDDPYGENLRLGCWIAGGNIAIWLLAHLTGVVELIGVSFAASVGLLLASYVLHEWHRERMALLCLAGALPLPLTIIALLT